ncbi:type I restriction endonuclease subunit R [Corynebacterium sp. zg254]|uniref:Type I restriction endonuclease subunit R n=1 Tax=Corynebacterium zhongnanshanii TaxID=2768834 RepID=A0ABQ6VE37_9CORY|nr:MULTISPECIES: type I restriction endonuclease [Corynebacterium]KAB3519843.1 type I restriction endonuclease subunit R [Corynebacterium zhongnanshanii]MCR5914777.1 type I restriction endonuclease subunit R [Corynebacterium sp. zg254]
MSEVEKSLANYLERGFEDTVVTELQQAGWVHDPSNADWDVARAIHVGDVLDWLQSQYPSEFDKAVPAKLAGAERQVAINKLLDRLVEMLNKPHTLTGKTKQVKNGLLGTLRYGFSHSQRGRQKATFSKMVEFFPENPLYVEVAEKAKTNRLRVMRQVRFDVNSTETLDLVLTVNGIPVVTMELKTDNTQAVTDAIKQYKQDRVPGKNRPLLKPGRALVHFAVSNQEVYMATVLAGANTVFLPFNKGDGFHAGNPHNTQGSDTAYLWKDVFEPELFLRILRDYALWEPAKKGNDGRLVFPRYHQLRACERVLADMTTNGVGGRYLVQHSAGSGKTKTIAWLAHRANRVCTPDGQPLFNSVIVVTDRTALDDNIKEGLDLLRASEGMVVSVDNELGSKSKKLDQALSSGGHIISCTIQTFPALARLMETNKALAGRKYCVIIDEAHSSQHGEAAKKLRETLVTADLDLADDEDISSDDMLVAVDSAVANSANISFVALTATPKGKTLATYGVPDPDDPSHRVPFDVYSMSQAIEEGFILDVLANYSTYSMFARIKDELGRTEVVDESAAVSDMVRFVRMHPTSIAQKVVVAVEHFRRNVMSHLDGTAKAMVVAPDRKAALTWSMEMNKYIAKQGYNDMTTLVAFSGSLDVADTQVTEHSLNGVKDTALHFRENEECKVLIVANKYQTGFDEPRLCAMYVDRKLSGVMAVQTLSRLNRTFPNKPKPMVVDFINDPQTIVDSFKPYFQEAHINAEIPANALDDLGEELDNLEFYTAEEVDELGTAFVENASSEKIQSLISPIRKNWNAHMREARQSGDKESLADGKAFRTNCIKYTNAWEFLSQIVDYQDPILHKRAIVTGLLAKNLKLERQIDDDDLTTGLEIVGVAVEPTNTDFDLGLAAEDIDGAIELPGFDGQPVSETSPVKTAFDAAVEKVNEILAAAGVSASDEAKTGAIRACYGKLVEDKQIQDLASENDSDQLAAAADFKQKGLMALLGSAQESQEVYTTLSADMDNVDTVLNALAALLVAASRDANVKKQLHD